MKIGLEYGDTDFPYKVICFAAGRLGRVCGWVEYIQARFDCSEGYSFSFKAIIVSPAGYKRITIRREVEFTCGLTKYASCKISPLLSEEDVQKAGEGLAEAIVSATDLLVREMKDMSCELELFARQKQKVVATSEK